MIHVFDRLQQLTAGELPDQFAVGVHDRPTPAFVVQHGLRDVDDVVVR